MMPVIVVDRRRPFNVMAQHAPFNVLVRQHLFDVMVRLDRIRANLGTACNNLHVMARLDRATRSGPVVSRPPAVLKTIVTAALEMTAYRGTALDRVAWPSRAMTVLQSPDALETLKLARMRSSPVMTCAPQGQSA
jgi:hypothetical protein